MSNARKARNRGRRVEQKKLDAIYVASAKKLGCRCKPVVRHQGAHPRYGDGMMVTHLIHHDDCPVAREGDVVDLAIVERA